MEINLPDSGTLETLKDELNEYIDKVVVQHDQLWFVKERGQHEDNNARKREQFVYLLGQGLVNVAEIKRITESELSRLQELEKARKESTIHDVVMVRIASSYSLEELPLKSLDEAVAGELVFSLWVRRRDATRHNYSYIRDISLIPVFFDLSASLDYEKWLRDIHTFWETKKHTVGHPGAWRVKEHKGDLGQAKAPELHSVHWINNVDTFKLAVDTFADKITSYPFHLIELAKEAGYTHKEAEKLTSFLVATRNTLRNDVEKLLEIVLQDIE